MEVWELKLYFYPSAGGLKKKKVLTNVPVNGVSGTTGILQQYSIVQNLFFITSSTKNKKEEADPGWISYTGSYGCVQH